MKPVLHIYTRVSQAKQEEGSSLANQRDLGIAKAKALGFSHRLWNEGSGSASGEDLSKREVLSALVYAIKNGEVKHLYVQDTTRLSRNDYTSSMIRYHLSTAGAKLYTKDGVISFDNPTDRLISAVLGVVGEFENSLRKERTRLGKIQRVKNGYWFGGPPPYGYQIVQKRLELESDEAATVKRIFEMYDRGKSLADIKIHLDSHGIPSRRGGMWNPGSLNALLSNTHPVGYYEYTDRISGETFKLSAPTIVGKPLWDRVQAKKAASSRQKQTTNPNTKHFYLLTELMVCGECHSRYRGRTAPSQHARHYYCPWKETDWKKNPGKSGTWKRDRGCSNTKSMNIPTTDKLVWETVRKVVKGAHLVREMHEDGGSGQGGSAEQKKRQARAKRLTKEIRDLREALGKFETNVVSGGVSASTAGHVRTDLRKAIADKEQELATCEDEIDSVKQEQKQALWLRNFDSYLGEVDQLPDQKKKQYLKRLVDRIEVFYNPAAENHRLDIHFLQPIATDVHKDNESDLNGRAVHKTAETALVSVMAKKNIPGKVKQARNPRT